MVTRLCLFMTLEAREGRKRIVKGRKKVRSDRSCFTTRCQEYQRSQKHSQCHRFSRVSSSVIEEFMTSSTWNKEKDQLLWTKSSIQNGLE